MKKLLIAIVFLISTNCFSQSDVKTSPGKEEIKADGGIGNFKLETPADSIAFISTVNLVQFVDYLKKNMSYEGYQKLTPDLVIAELYKYAIIEWNNKKKVKK